MLRRLVVALVVLVGALVVALAQPELVPIAVVDARDVQRLVAALQAPETPGAERVAAAKRLAVLCTPETAPVLIGALGDLEAGVREYAARALGILGDPVAVPALVKLREDPTATVRLAAVTALGRLEDARALETLIAALNDPDAPVQQAAALGLGRLQTPQAAAALRQAAAAPTAGGAQALLALARRGDRTITPVCIARAQAEGFKDTTVAMALAELGDPQATAVMLTLATHPDEGIRRCACLGLARTGDARAVDQLMAHFKAKSAETRDSRDPFSVWYPALRALPPAEATRVLRPWLREESLWLSEAAARVFCYRYDYEPAGLLEILGNRQGVHPWTIKDWLEARQPQGIVEALLATDPRLDLVHTLTQPRQMRDGEQLDGLLGPPPAPIAFPLPQAQRGCWVMTPQLREKCLAGKEVKDGLQGSRMKNLCHSGDHSVSAAVCAHMLTADEVASVDWCGRGLGVLADPCAIPSLLKVLERPEGQARYGALAGLTGCADARHTESYQVLLQTLESPKVEVRKGAIAALGACHEARAVPTLIATLKADTTPEVREYCALSLGLIGDTRAVAPLCAALRDPVEWARSAAAWALGELGDQQAIDPLRAALQAYNEPRFRVRVARSLYLLGDRDAALTLAELSGNQDWMTREIAVRALLECNEPRITGSLVARMYQQPDSGTIQALGRQRDEQAIRPLCWLLTEPDYTNYLSSWDRQAAARALGRIGEGRTGVQVTRAADVLYRSYQQDAEPGVRACAALALARLRDARAEEAIAWVMHAYVPERNAAIRALWSLDTPKGNALLAEALADDDPLGVVLAARGLALHKDPRGAQTLRTLVTTVREPVARQLALRFAGELQDPALAPVFANIAKATHEEANITLVLEAIAALGQCGGAEATRTLTALLNSPASRLREAAARALTGTKDTQAVAALRARLQTDEATAVRAAITAALATKE